MDAALSGLPFVHLTTAEAERALHGIALRTEDGWQMGEPVRMLDSEGGLVAIGFYDSASRSLRPRVVFSP
jgi:hypothetical protein